VSKPIVIDSAKLIGPETKKRVAEWRQDWNKFARDILQVRLDSDQQKILESVQYNRRTVVRSGHARGKDYVAAVASLCFLLMHDPVKVISTAPTERQVKSVMMAELATLYNKLQSNPNIPMEIGGKLTGLRLTISTDRFLEGFKASDKKTTDWTGLHSAHQLVVATEASGLEDETFEAIDGLLTGVISRFLMVGNPTRLAGHFYKAFKDPRYNMVGDDLKSTGIQSRFALNCLESPNVKARKIVIPGQVDASWVEEKLGLPGWTQEIPAENANPDDHDFEYAGVWYRPSDLFLIKVLGEFPRTSDDTLIPLTWIESANRRWQEWYDFNMALPEEKRWRYTSPLRLGVDVAGEGTDLSVFCYRYGDIVEKFDVPGYKGDDILMQVTGAIQQILGKSRENVALVDTVGVGAGVAHRAAELKENRVISAKFSYAARRRPNIDKTGESQGKRLKDSTGERTFRNMRAYTYWMLRESLNPAFNGQLALPQDDMLAEELSETRWKVSSEGHIEIEPKDKIRERINRSPDRADALALTFFPNDIISPKLPEPMSRSAFGV